jgi:hypothetical protein
VLAVLPRFLSENDECCDALAAAILNELDHQSRVYPSVADGSLVAALGFTMTDGFDEAPTTMPALIAHPDVLGRTFLCNAGDLDQEHRLELGQFIVRLNDESRPLPMAGRATIVVILGRDSFERDPASPAMTAIWYWDRVARWDTAALLASTSGVDLPGGVAGEVRLETIIEVARWNFELALELAGEWASAQFDVVAWLGTTDHPTSGLVPPRRTALKQPPESHLAEWDAGVVEAWHGVPGIAPIVDVQRAGGIERLIWRAQSRVLMPWLELRRVRIEQIVRETLGATRMELAVAEYTYRFPGVEHDPESTVELATLSRIISARIGRSNNRLRDTARQLVSARNRLAHLRPLPEDDVAVLIRESSWLD